MPRKPRFRPFRDGFWEWFDPFKGYYPTGPHLYALYLNRRLRYIGQTNLLKTRLNIHINDMRRWNDRADFMIKIRSVRDKNQALELENLFIKKLQPPGNTKHISLKEDLVAMQEEVETARRRETKFEIMLGSFSKRLTYLEDLVEDMRNKAK